MHSHRDDGNEEKSSHNGSGTGQSLNHYQFAQRLKWYAKKYEKIVIDCNESYTSKTRSWDGTIDDKLGGKKAIRGYGFSVSRDINGARGILLKQLSKAA